MEHERCKKESIKRYQRNIQTYKHMKTMRTWSLLVFFFPDKVAFELPAEATNEANWVSHGFIVSGLGAVRCLGVICWLKCFKPQQFFKCLCFFWDFLCEALSSSVSLSPWTSKAISAESGESSTSCEVQILESFVGLFEAKSCKIIDIFRNS